MKSKKKMLLALGAMSAAAIGAGATSTFAWYQSTQKAAFSQAATADVISALPQTNALDVSVNVTVAPVTNTSTMIMAMRDNDAWASKYYNDAAQAYAPYAASGTEVYSKAYSVSVEAVATSPYSKAEVGQMIASTGLKFKVEAAAKLVDETDNPLVDRTHVWSSASALADNAYAVDSAAFTTSTLLGSTWDGTTKIVGYVCVWVSGQTSAQTPADTNDGTSAKTTSFTVTVANV